MIYKRFRKEGPGELPAIDYATNEDELRTLTDEETAAIVHAKKAAKETEEAILAAQQKAAESEGQLEAALESKQDAHARVAEQNAKGAVIETVDVNWAEKLVRFLTNLDGINGQAMAELGLAAGANAYGASRAGYGTYTTPSGRTPWWPACLVRPAAGRPGRQSWHVAWTRGNGGCWRSGPTGG